MHIETITYQATAPSTGAAAAAATGDSLTIKNSKGPARIVAQWAMNQVDGYHQITYPSAHDTTRGYRTVVEALSVNMRLPLGVPLTVQPQELLSISIAGSATAGDVESGILAVMYDDLPGVAGRYITYAEMLRRASTLTTIQATLTGAAAGYTGSELITAESDLLRANQDYAVLGIETNVQCAAVCLRGPDTAYQRVAVPGEPTRGEMTGGWFGLLSRMLDRSTIPVINSGNRAATYLDFVQNENNVSPVVSVNLVMLGGR